MSYRVHRDYFTHTHKYQDSTSIRRPRHPPPLQIFFFCGATAQIDRAYAALFLRFLDHTQLHARYGTQDQPDSDAVSYTTRNKYKRRTCMLSARFEPKIPAIK